jgi:hypothetical protein
MQEMATKHHTVLVVGGEGGRRWQVAEGYGMVALRVGLDAMFKVATVKELKTTSFGKPQIGTFQFATRLLQQ